MAGGARAVRKNPQVAFRQLTNGESVLLHLGSGSYHGLNPTGALVWDLIDGDRAADELSAEVRARLDDAPADVDRVVTEFLHSLRERDLVLE